MSINLQTARILRIVFLLFVSMFLSFNTYAVKKSIVVNNEEVQEANTRIYKSKKPSLFQRLGMKVLTKKLTKKVAKFNKEGSTQETKLKKGMAIAALILGILAFFTSFIGIPLAILAIVLGAIAQKRAKEQPEVYGGKGMATAGLVLGIVGIGLLIIIFGFLFFSGLLFIF